MDIIFDRRGEAVWQTLQEKFGEFIHGDVDARVEVGDDGANHCGEATRLATRIHGQESVGRE
jgi:hypothetical protein